MDIIFHYPPELLNLLVDTIPALCRGKKDVILFFKGAGVDARFTKDLTARINRDKDSISKYEIARTILTRLNEKGEATLRERREIIKRVGEFENFSSCWPSDQLKAKGLVAEVRKVVDIKDSFTRMRLAKEAEEQKHRQEQEERNRKESEKKETLAQIRKDLFRLFGMTDPWKRGKALEGVMNRLFSCAGVGIREAFTLTGIESEGIVEQIDGAIEIAGNIYLVEMKWTREPLGKAELSEHLMRIFVRDGVRAIFISASGYTDPAVTMCRESLHSAVVVLCKLEEFVVLLDNEADLVSFLNDKIQAAIIHKNPYFEPVKRSG
jgi:restriction system protein